MEIPRDEGFIRKTVQRKATGKTPEDIARETHDAHLREQQARHAPRDTGETEALVKAQWKHAEWRRISTVMTREVMDHYDPAHDPQARQWAQERARHAAHLRARQRETETAGEEDAGAPRRDELCLFLWLDGPEGRRLHALAARYGLSTEQLLTQLAAGAQAVEGERLTVPPFTPHAG